jgi:hypothetical protein
MSVKLWILPDGSSSTTDPEMTVAQVPNPSGEGTVEVPVALVKFIAPQGVVTLDRAVALAKPLMSVAASRRDKPFVLEVEIT